MEWDANWVGAIEQVAGALIAAAAWLAYRTASTAERISKNAVAARGRGHVWTAAAWQARW